ncbi:RING finger domain-containing protein [Stemphylium lycopersici]|uniref:E3 ubiquitin-protein ligase n=1 Tax=Stemphylium lycopersici TaxID=183478 RepID=A0A364N851_STELY|nr:ubiquitin-protein ligase e3 component [Stemphylium lycopersici]RAR03286.1 RING finger domain-containing protein [Stemphylium lycopersici]RAR13494.1 RING finger domain-containing protein [Stemphylium lycopersici]
MYISLHEQELCRQLRELPRRHNYRFEPAADRELREVLFRSLAGRDHFLPLFFPNGPQADGEKPWSLRDAQGAVEGAEYTAAARGKPCGHIFKNGEATYRCKTCTADDTCVLCARCFDASDHDGHQVFVSVSPGNSGCCDCGDDEAWVRPVHCNIHSAHPEAESKASGKAREASMLPDELVETIRITIARTLDYLIDVFSCSPEQLRLPKSEESIRQDERNSRLTSKWYDSGDQPEECEEYCLVLWNDEKHTVNDVRDQVARACKQKLAFGLAKAYEINDVGRSAIVYRTELSDLLRMAKIIEEIKLTVTIRSARDTFREQMGGALIEWISDIAGCSVGQDNQILRRTVCEELLKPWRVGSEASNQSIGTNGLDDHEMEDREAEMDGFFNGLLPIQRRARIIRVQRQRTTDANDDTTASDDDDDDEEGRPTGDAQDDMDIDEVGAQDNDGDVEMEAYESADETGEVPEATMAGYPAPPPPPPPPHPQRGQLEQSVTPAESDSEPVVGAPSLSHVEPMLPVPETPHTRSLALRPARPARYWLEKPEGYGKKPGIPPHEDLWQRLRLDHLILYDLRMWKQLRIGIRDVFISTVVTIPEFKRLLGLRFAGVYTALAQLYLIADREPDHSIINLSLQMLTTPSITSEVVERGNFLTNLMAILYTFLTTRQVGYPSNVDQKATLAFEQGAVTNRRMYHFFLDMKYLLGSEFVQERIREEPRYLLQFLDLVKLHQGICPNVRQVGEHLEFESEAWISASLITREINKLCRHFAESFAWSRGEDPTNIQRAIRAAAKVAIINSLGAERKRFDQTELKEETKFKTLDILEFDTESLRQPYKVVDYVVASQPMSFHHALHYTVSWLIDRARGMDREDILRLLLFSNRELQMEVGPALATIPAHDPEEYLLAMFDFPLRVCSWLAQMRAGIWVRNGITLRHQMTQYRSVSQRDVSHQRDIFLLQSALVLCDPSVFLASMVDRFGLTGWMTGKYEASQHGFEDSQAIDVVEDFVHLLIVVLSERTSLIPVEDNDESQLASMRKDIAHVLCFKPLSFSDMTARLSDRIQNLDEFPEVLSEMTRFRAPEGLSDSGTFELKEQYIDLIDPYLHQYNRNQREEAENTYKAYMAKKTGKQASDIVYEPKLRHIPSGLFQDLSAFTRTPLFTQIIYYLLGYGLKAATATPSIPATRVETYIQFVLQLLLVAVLEDRTTEHGWSEKAPESFVTSVLTKNASMGIQDHPTVLSILKTLQDNEAFKASEPKISLILHRLKQRQQDSFIIAAAAINMPADRMDTASPAPQDKEHKELKKKQALERQAKVMAAFKEQQGKFLANQEFDWGEDDFSDLEDETGGLVEQEKTLKFPSGTCILCQEDCNEQRLYGSFGYISESRILRQTPLEDAEWVDEVVQTPDSLDRSADHLRPFGVAGKNRRTIEKVTATGERVISERQELGKGFPPASVAPGPVTTGCGHIMHFACFEVYLNATQRRHVSQIARNHPERPELKEFMCPLCKALGNIFLPIIWKAKKVSSTGVLETEETFDVWLESQLVATHKSLEKGLKVPVDLSHDQKMLHEYAERDFIQPVSSRLPDLLKPQLPTTGLALAQPPTQLAPRFQVPAFLGVQPPDLAEPGLGSSQTSPALTQDAPMGELIKIYHRLRDTLKVNNIQSSFVYPHTPAISEDFTHTDALAQALGYSIAAAEIAQRGVQSEAVRGTLIDKISPQTITHLRIFSESVSSYIAIGGLRGQGPTKTMDEFSEIQRRQFRQLLVGHPGIYDPDVLSFDLKGITPLLCQDPFIFLSQCAVGVVPATNLDIHHIMRLCYLAEIVRVMFTFALGGKQQSTEDMPQDSDLLFPYPEQFINQDKVNNSLGSPEQMNNLLFFVCVMSNVTSMGDSPSSLDIDNMPIPSRFKDPNFLYFMYTMVSTYALPFVRKAVILMHVRYGIDLPHVAAERADEPELARLSTILRLPSLDEIFSSFASRTSSAHTTRSIVGGWLRHLLWAQAGNNPIKPTISLSHPAIFELVGLPKNYDTLTDEAIRRRCPTTGKELTDPALCLFCGEIMCSQAVCCMTNKNRGGCNQHLAKCGGQIGLFIHIRKCMILFLNLDHGTWHVAPYLDKHGEVDPALRRHHQLFLNQKRYDALLRKVWLEGGVQSLIARRLEGDVNNGGWESL